MSRPTSSSDRPPLSASLSLELAKRRARVLRELEARGLRPRPAWPGSESPVALAKLAGIELDPWQREVVTAPDRQIILNCSRQSGKTTAAGALALWTAMYRPPSLVLMLSPTLRQSGEFFRDKVLAMYRALGRPVSAEHETALTLTLDNGSRIVSLPSKDGTVRGYAGVDLLIFDEAAWLPDAIYMACRPMLAVSGGRLLAASTPHGTRGWFYEAWEKGGDAWRHFQVTAAQCPRISDEFLAGERRLMGQWWYEQEYFCRFLDAQSQAFTREEVDRMLDEEAGWWDSLDGPPAPPEAPAA